VAAIHVHQDKPVLNKPDLLFERVSGLEIGLPDLSDPKKEIGPQQSQKHLSKRWNSLGKCDVDVDNGACRVTIFKR
jgi:hypothetical protein